MGRDCKHAALVLSMRFSCFAGNGEVGKTSLLKRFARSTAKKGKFAEVLVADYPAFIALLKQTGAGSISVGDTVVKLVLWDVSTLATMQCGA